MKTVNKIIGITILLITIISTQQLEAQRRGDNPNIGGKTQRTYNNKRSVGTKHHREDRFRIQPIHRNQHYRYPRHNRIVRTLHHNHLRMAFRGLTYFYYSGIYYTVYGDEYIVVVPPRGFRIAVLPIGYSRIIVGPRVFFYHSGVYYMESKNSGSDEKYEITQPPVGAIITDISNDAEQIIMDGNVLYEYNNVFYKKIISDNGETTYEVVYSKNTND